MLCKVPSLPLVTDMEKVQGLKHQLRNKLLWVVLSKMQMVCSFPSGVVDRQADVGGFICVS